MNLGILDLGRDLAGCSASVRIERTVEMARLAEEHGFHRYWLAEHHVDGTSLAAPEVILAVIAVGTRAIKVGSGGVLLRYYSPLKIAEVYLTLAAAFPQRVELGVCRGPGVSEEQVELALVSGNTRELAPESYDAKLDELFSILRPQEMPHPLMPHPRNVASPPIWVLGSGTGSVNQALRNNSRYGFMCFFPDSDSYGPNLMARYLDQLSAPVAEGPLIAVSVVCGETSQKAHQTHDALLSRGYLPSNVVGDREYCTERIRELAVAYQASDVLLACGSPDFKVQCDLIRLLGEA